MTFNKVRNFAVAAAVAVVVTTNLNATSSTTTVVENDPNDPLVVVCARSYRFYGLQTARTYTLRQSLVDQMIASPSWIVTYGPCD